MDRKYIKLILAFISACLITLPELIAVAQPADPWGIPGAPGGTSQPSGSGTVRGPGGPPPPPPIICIDTGEPPPKGEKCKTLAEIIGPAVAAETEKQKKEAEARANEVAVRQWAQFHITVGIVGFLFAIFMGFWVRKNLRRFAGLLIQFDSRLKQLERK
jgi:hypothetical protein